MGHQLRWSNIDPHGRQCTTPDADLANTLDLRQARYQAVDERRTRVTGARFTARSQPTLKVEGARWVGSRAVLLAGIADPVMQGELPTALAQVEAKVRGEVAALCARYPLYPNL